MKRGFQVFYRYKELEDGDKVLVKKKNGFRNSSQGEESGPKRRTVTDPGIWERRGKFLVDFKMIMG